MRRGFALPAVLAITGVVCLALLAAVEAVDSLGRSARDRAERLRFEASAMDLEARATFSALTRPTTLDAIVEAGRDGRDRPLFLDGSPYLAATGDVVSLQDEAGLINLNTVPSASWIPILRTLGADADEARRLWPRVADFIDPDGDRRPGGAEAPDYRRADVPPPPNGYLRGRVELLGVLGLTGAVSPQEWRAARGYFVTDAYDTPINLNTAPAAVLMARYGLTSDQAARALRVRRERPFTTLEDFGRVVGLALVGDAERAMGRPAGRYRLQVRRAGMTYESRIVLTPTGGGPPFRVEQRAVALPGDREPRQSATDAAPPPVPWN